LTTGIIWAQVRKIERFGACFCTCALIIWSVLLQLSHLIPISWIHFLNVVASKDLVNKSATLSHD
jgi:hypothetical protein